VPLPPGALWHYTMLLVLMTQAGRPGQRLARPDGDDDDGKWSDEAHVARRVDVALINRRHSVEGVCPLGYGPYTEIEPWPAAAKALPEAVHLPHRDAGRASSRGPSVPHDAARRGRRRLPVQNHISPRDSNRRFHVQTRVAYAVAKNDFASIGDAAALAKGIHIPVMHDFYRAAEVRRRWQGAPFVPVYHPRATRRRSGARMGPWSWSISAASPTSL